MHQIKVVSLLVLFCINQQTYAATSHEAPLKKLVAALKINAPGKLSEFSMSYENTLRYLEKIRKHCGVGVYNATKKILIRNEEPAKAKKRLMKKLEEEFEDLRKAGEMDMWRDATYLGSKVLKKTNECGTLHYSVSMKIKVGDKNVSAVATIVNVDTNWYLHLLVHDEFGSY